jgi:hypothetical protein
MKNLLTLCTIVSCSLALSATATVSAQSTSATSVTVTMNAQNASGETGTAKLEQTGSDVTVTLALTGGGSDPQPAHIHQGTCAKLNPAPKYPLTNVVAGKSVTVLKGMKLTDLETGAFAVNVHKSTSDIGTYVSCGDIPKAAASGGSM